MISKGLDRSCDNPGDHAAGGFLSNSTPWLERQRTEPVTNKDKATTSVRNPLATGGPSSQLIGAVAKMATYEAMFGDSKGVELHRAGIIKMIEMRWGLSSMGLNEVLARMCVWVDRNSAMLLNILIHTQNFYVEVDPSGLLLLLTMH
jgi:hypothetical protein